MRRHSDSGGEHIGRWSTSHVDKCGLEIAHDLGLRSPGALTQSHEPRFVHWPLSKGVIETFRICFTKRGADVVPSNAQQSTLLQNAFGPVE